MGAELGSDGMLGPNTVRALNRAFEGEREIVVAIQRDAAVDMEDGPKGFGAHSDQERILESELHRFVRFNWDVVTNLARAK